MPQPPLELETPLTSFVGRSRELLALGEEVLAGRRLITLVGPAGCGKSRLGLEFARHHRESQPDIAVLRCDLGAVSTDHAISAIGARLPGASASDSPSSLASALRGCGRALLLLDNVEHLTPALDDWLIEWLEAAPELTVIATSRVVLATLGGLRFEVAPLPTADGVALYGDRAACVAPAVETDGAAATVIAKIVDRLDGLPLAIELAAARTSVLSNGEIFERLADRFEFLDRRSPGRPSRSNSLHAAIDWSWQLLEPWERSALAQCSVLRGFDLAAAESIIRLPPTAPPVLDVVQSLHEKSLLVRAQTARFRLYESIREFAATHLDESGEGEQARQRHAEYYAALGDRQSHAVNPRTVPSRLIAEADNLLAAYEWSRAHAPNLAARAALALHPILLARGPFAMHVELLDWLVATARAGSDQRLLARALVARASTLRDSLPAQQLAPDLDTACDLAAALGDDALLGTARICRAGVRREAGEYDDATTDARAAHDALHSIGDHVGAGHARLMLASIAYCCGQLDAAGDHYEAARAEFAPAGDLFGQAIAEANLALVASELGRLDDAQARYARALADNRAVGNLRAAASILEQVGSIHIATGRYAAAHAALGEALTARQSLGSAAGETMCRSAIALTELAAGRPREALQSSDRAVEIARGLDSPRCLGFALTTHAAALAASDRVDSAVETFARAEAEVGRSGDPVLAQELSVFLGILDIATARQALDAGCVDEATSSLAKAKSRIQTASSGRLPIGCRVANHILCELLSRHHGTSAAAADDEFFLEVSADATWARINDQEPVSLVRKRLLRPLLSSLVAGLRNHPGIPVTTATLLNAGWPHDRIDSAKLRERLYVAISALRKLGLDPVLHTTDSGYMLDPRVVVGITED